MLYEVITVLVYRLAALLALNGDSESALQQLHQAMTAYPAGLGAAIVQLEALARDHPAEITPLLELASAKRAQRRTPAANR